MLPNYGPLPQPKSLEEARIALRHEAFPAPRVDTITFRALEFTTHCPNSGQPDFGEVEITYVPGSQCLESKSLKFYLWAYRESAAYCEQLTAQIADDIVEAISPVYVKVQVFQNVRGGITLTSTATRGVNPLVRG